MTTLLLVRYGELGLKSAPVRREFERTLRRNILAQFAGERRTCRIRSDHGHIYVEVDDSDFGLRLLQRVFGITSVSPVHEVPSEVDAIRSAVLQMADRVLAPGSRFAIRARRTGQHSFTSQDLARDIGGTVLERWRDRGVTVDLEEPMVELTVEVRGPKTYLYSERRPGPGGLPLGVAGKVVALVDGPRGALGAYLMMKRGCYCGLVAPPSGRPYVQEVLVRFDPKAPTNFPGEDPMLWEQALRDLSESGRADGVVLPIGVEDYPDAKSRWGDRVLFSPTVGFTDAEVESRWRSVKDLVA